MPSLSGVFKGSGTSTGDKRSSIVRSQSLTDAAEPQQIEDAMRGVSLIMEDDLAGADKALESGNSVYHKLGVGVIWFMRATMGYEPEVMRGATERLGIAETAANDQRRRAQRETPPFQSDIYPPGTEYALCNAEAQIMSAVVALTTESLTEALKGFYKVKKALTTLESIAQSEREYLKRRSVTSLDSPGSSDSNKSTGKSSMDLPNGVNGANGVNGVNNVELHGEGTADEEVFADAEEVSPERQTKTEKYLGHMESSGILHDMSDLYHAPTSNSNAPTPGTKGEYIPRSDFKNTVDIFIHTGYLLIHGMILLMLSFVPPTFNKILSLIGFRGDRDRGLDMLWHASTFPGLNGSMAGLIVIGFYSGTISSLEIVPSDTIPRAAWDDLVAKLRKQYPKSGLLLVEDARARITARHLEDARKLLTSCSEIPIKQIESMRWFEISLTSMYLHRYAQCADSFLTCLELNTWSPALYYYIAAACHVELYRTYKYAENADEVVANGATINGEAKKSNEEKAAHHAAKVDEYLAKVPANLGKKRMFSKPPPFDTFVSRKHTKWTARAKSRGVPLADAAGVSPMEEMNYFWAGYKRMQPEDLRASLERLRFSDGGAGDPGEEKGASANGDASKENVKPVWKPEAAAAWDDECDDEKASLALLRATVYRHLGQASPARELLGDMIDKDKYKWATFKSSGGGAGRDGDLWAIPCARYELAVCAWMEYERAKAQGGDRAAEARLLKECGSNLEQVANWENFDLDTRIGMKIAAGRETVKNASGS